MHREILRMDNVGCKAGTNQLLAGNLSVLPGEIMGVAGLQNSGAPELIRILKGELPCESGGIYIDDRPADLSTPAKSRKAGIFYIQSGSVLNQRLTVAENLMVTNDYQPPGLVVNYREIRRRAGHLLREMGLEVSPQTPAGELTTFQQHAVMLAKARYAGCGIVILDNITRRYTQEEVRGLGQLLRQLSARGNTFLCLMLQLDSLCQFMDRVTVLNRGITTKVVRGGSVSSAQLSRMITGVMAEQPPRERVCHAPVVLRAQGLLAQGMDKPVSFSVRRGETVALVDADKGAGRLVTDLLTGMSPPDLLEGGLELSGAPLQIRCRADSIRAGIAFLPEDAARQGLCRNMSLEENILLGLSGRFSARIGSSQSRMGRYLTRDFLKTLGDTPWKPWTKVEQLDEISCFAALFYKWRLISPSLFVMINPMVYHDEVIRDYIVRQIAGLNREGVAVLVLTKNLYDLYNCYDRTIQI